MRGAAGRARSILRQYSGTSDFAWRYVLNARPTLLHGLRERPLRGEGARVLRDLNRDGIALTVGLGVVRRRWPPAGSAGGGRTMCRNAWPSRLWSREKPPTIRMPAIGSRSSCGCSGTPVRDWPRKRPGPRASSHAIPCRIPYRESPTCTSACTRGSTTTTYGGTSRPRLPARESQLWHRDPMPEDRFVLKVFTCLTDVDDASGPFVYAAGTHHKGSVRREPDFLHKDGETPRSDDGQMARVVPPNAWVRGVGSAGTIIFADTRGYHKGGLAQERDRLLHIGVFRPPGLRSGGLCTSHYRAAVARASR